LIVNWQLALITLSVAPVVAVVAFVFRRLARRAQQQAQRAQATVNATIGETISGIAVAKNFRQEAALFGDFQAINALAYRVQLVRVAVFGSIFPLLNTLSGMGVAVVVYFGGLQVLRGSIGVGEWYLFVQSLAIFFYPITSISSFWSQFQQGLAASERVFALIDAEPRVMQTAQLPLDHVRGEIVFDRVSFSYADGGPTTKDEGRRNNSAGQVGANGMPQLDPAFVGGRSSFVLNDFSLHIAAGETLAIVGHTGAGKSSLVKLIMRFYEFQAGQLLIDGCDIRTLDLAQYRRHVGYVPQAPFLFDGTVADNIRYGRRDATLAEVERAARQLGDGTWVDDLPNGLKTTVGERGGRLSLGQRQLVALARVLFHGPAIVLLDEATASIDPVTETQIQAGLDVVLRGRTSIAIAHRLSTVRAADRIIVLRSGQVIEAGTHEHLLARGGHYAELYNAYFRHQASDYQV
jgi:ABC-type multidrug transport system fused ATPase/permease subunit